MVSAFVLCYFYSKFTVMCGDVYTERVVLFVQFDGWNGSVAHYVTDSVFGCGSILLAMYFVC